MTPAVRALQKAGVAHRLLTYDHDPATTAYGLEAAERLQVPPGAVFKTLLVEADPNQYLLGLVPVTSTLDLRALARAAGVKRLAMADSAAAERLTGYVVGGISPFGQRRSLPTYVDESALGWDEIYVSGGRRGVEIALSPQALVDVSGATTASISAG